MHTQRGFFKLSIETSWIPGLQLVICLLCTTVSHLISSHAVESEGKAALCWHDLTLWVSSWKTCFDTELNWSAAIDTPCPAITRITHSHPCESIHMREDSRRLQQGSVIKTHFICLERDGLMLLYSHCLNVSLSRKLCRNQTHSSVLLFPPIISHQIMCSGLLNIRLYLVLK